MEGYFIKYQFILPDNTKHSSYSYQKLFRAIYGYTQNVTKSGGKTYRYFRKGVLSDVPYIKAGKNSVIIPPYALNKFLNFLKSGNNPAHCWKTKGSWKAQFYMDEKKLTDEEVAKALDDLLDRLTIDTKEGSVKLSDVLSQLSFKKEFSKELGNLVLNESQKIINLDWFKECYMKSSKLQKFYDDYKKARLV
ncbi:MAG: hypothetical protein N3D73_01885 [Candidatus Diapherotrites archaeon]|nr:hypothetical protein [Candidatus Diapherotrites archaeon]